MLFFLFLFCFCVTEGDKCNTLLPPRSSPRPRHLQDLRYSLSYGAGSQIQGRQLETPLSTVDSSEVVGPKAARTLGSVALGYKRATRFPSSCKSPLTVRGTFWPQSEPSLSQLTGVDTHASAASDDAQLFGMKVWCVGGFRLKCCCIFYNLWAHLQVEPSPARTPKRRSSTAHQSCNFMMIMLFFFWDFKRTHLNSTWTWTLSHVSSHTSLILWLRVTHTHTHTQTHALHFPVTRGQNLSW